MAAGISAHAGDSGVQACSFAWPEPFALHQPYLLNDPRTGLMLYVESDGRHVAAITREGRILWQRNLFDDPKLESEIPPPPDFPGEPPFSDEKGIQWVRSYLGRLVIDRIGAVSDCEMQIIDRVAPPLFHGHYIRAGSGTHIFYLLDAKTGDFLVDQIN
jgi:hypothetical protein